MPISPAADIRSSNGLGSGGNVGGTKPARTFSHWIDETFTISGLRGSLSCVVVADNKAEADEEPDD